MYRICNFQVNNIYLYVHDMFITSIDGSHVDGSIQTNYGSSKLSLKKYRELVQSVRYLFRLSIGSESL